MIRTIILPDAVIPVGSTVADKRWTRGTIVGKGDHNHNDGSYTMCVTKKGWLITRNSKHMKPTQITAKQYLQDQLDKHIVTNSLEDIPNKLKNKHLYTTH